VVGVIMICIFDFDVCCLVTLDLDCIIVLV